MRQKYGQETTPYQPRHRVCTGVGFLGVGQGLCLQCECFLFQFVGFLVRVFGFLRSECSFLQQFFVRPFSLFPTPTITPAVAVTTGRQHFCLSHQFVRCNASHCRRFSRFVCGVPRFFGFGTKYRKSNTFKSISLYVL